MTDKEFREDAAEIVADALNDAMAICTNDDLRGKEYTVNKDRTESTGHIELVGFWCADCGCLTLMDSKTLHERFERTGKRRCDNCNEKAELDK